MQYPTFGSDFMNKVGRISDKPSTRFFGMPPNFLFPSDPFGALLFELHDVNNQSYLWSLLNEKFTEDYDPGTGHTHSEKLNLGINWLQLAGMVFVSSNGGPNPIDIMGMFILPAPYDTAQAVYMFQSGGTSSVRWRFAPYHSPSSYSVDLTEWLDNDPVDSQKVSKGTVINLSELPLDPTIAMRRIHFRLQLQSTDTQVRLGIPLMYPVNCERL